MQKINRRNSTWPGRRLFLVLGLAVMGLVQPALAARQCEVPVNVTFRDQQTDPVDSVRSDGRRTYTDADIECDGDLFFFFGPLVFQLNVFGGASPQADGNVVFEVPIENGFEGLDGLLGMAVGESAQTTKVQFNFVVGTRRYWLAYRELHPGTDDLSVTRLDANTWEVEAVAFLNGDKTKPGAVANVRSTCAKGKCPVIDHGNQNAPFKITVVRQQKI